MQAPCLHPPLFRAEIRQFTQMLSRALRYAHACRGTRKYRNCAIRDLNQQWARAFEPVKSGRGQPQGQRPSSTDRGGANNIRRQCRSTQQLPQQPIAAFNNPSKRDLQTAGRNTQQEPILLRKIELHCPPATATETVLLSILHHDTALRLGGEAWQGGPEMRRNSPHAKDTSAQNASAI
jgi:hypothetical protein